MGCWGPTCTLYICMFLQYQSLAIIAFIDNHQILQSPGVPDMCFFQALARPVFFALIFPTDVFLFISAVLWRKFKKNILPKWWCTTMVQIKDFFSVNKSKCTSFSWRNSIPHLFFPREHTHNDVPTVHRNENCCHRSWDSKLSNLKVDPIRPYLTHKKNDYKESTVMLP